MPTQITSWTDSLWHGLTAGLDRFANGVPTVLGALLILILGWIIAGALAALVVKGSRAAHLDTLGDRIKVNDFLQRAGTRMKASDILGEVVKWGVRLVFIEMAAEQCGLTQVTALVNGILGYIPNILVALLVLGVGAFLARSSAASCAARPPKRGWATPACWRSWPRRPSWPSPSSPPSTSLESRRSWSTPSTLAWSPPCLWPWAWPSAWAGAIRPPA